MGSKLKKKTPSNRFKPPFSNMKMQHMAREFHATREELRMIEETAFNNGWQDGEKWSNIINTVAFYFALNELHGFGGKRFFEVVTKANDYVREANAGKRTVIGMMEEMEKKTEMEFSEDYKKLVLKIGL